MAVQSIKSREAQHYPDLNLPDHAEIDSEDDKGGGWLISFVDLLTLLLTLFVLLLAFNQISQSDTPRHITTPTAAPIAAITHHDTTPLPPPQQTPEPTAKPLPKLTIPQDIKDKVDIIATSSEVNLIIKDDVLFDEGSPKLKTQGASVLDRIVQLLSQNDYPVSVEGHTDNIPIHTAQFPSNWELSTFRATTVTRYFIDHGIAIDRLRAIGYADTHPIADNDSEEGRARNRRVSLVVHVNESANKPQVSMAKPGNDASPSLQTLE
jgi:chemotaxis protein MotB